MLDLETLNSVDSEKMYAVYDKWPQMAMDAYNSDLDTISNSDEITHVVFAGMGGSGAINDIFASILSKTEIHVEVVKGYHLPNTVNASSLVVATSVSGNTEETLSVLDSAVKSKSGCKAIAFSNGGKMKNYCNSNRIPHMHILQTHSPRASFPSFLYSMLKVLEPVLPIHENDIRESITALKEIRDKNCSENLDATNESLKLAGWLGGVPIIYFPWGLQAAAIRFKNSLQENAKFHAITEDIIEACHNGIVSWQRNSDLKPILVRGKDDYIKTKERWEIIKEYFDSKGIDYKEVFSGGGSILTKLIRLIYVLDYSTIYFAVRSGIDPTPIEAIDFVKERLSSSNPDNK